MTDPRTLYRTEVAKRERVEDRHARIMADAKREFDAMIKSEKPKLTPAQQKSQQRGTRKFQANAAQRRAAK